MSAKIAVVGCGFVGSIFTTEFLKLAFAGELPYSFAFFDGDTWEPRNAANQNVVLTDAIDHLPKAETMAKLARQYHHEASWEQVRITDDNIEQLLGDAFIIIDAVDNLKTRQLLYDFGMRTDKPILHFGLNEMGTGVVEWSHPEHDMFHLAPWRRIGKPEVKDPASGVTPPCELVRMRSVGWLTSYAAALSLAIFLGFDPMAHLAEEGKSHGWMTEWSASPSGYQPIRETWSYVRVD